MGNRIIDIDYGCGTKRTEIITEETDRYIYFTNGWIGINERYDKTQQIVEQQLRDGSWSPYRDFVAQVKTR